MIKKAVIYLRAVLSMILCWLYSMKREPTYREALRSKELSKRNQIVDDIVDSGRIVFSILA